MAWSAITSTPLNERNSCLSLLNSLFILVQILHRRCFLFDGYAAHGSNLLIEFDLSQGSCFFVVVRACHYTTAHFLCGFCSNKWEISSPIYVGRSMRTYLFNFREIIRSNEGFKCKHMMSTALWCDTIELKKFNDAASFWLPSFFILGQSFWLPCCRFFPFAHRLRVLFS